MRTPGLTVGSFIEQVDVLTHAIGELENRMVAPLNAAWFEDQRVDELVHRCRALVDEIREARGLKRSGIEEAHEQEARERAVTETKREAYAGWLITNPRYRTEVHALTETWNETVCALGGFPVRSSGKTQAEPTAIEDAFRGFYERWCLERLLTWELPLPLAGACSTGQELTPQEGVCIQIPWPMVRGSQLDLRAVLRRIRYESAPAHLREWVWGEDDSEAGPGGEISCGRLFTLYRILPLALLRRYRTACQGRMEHLDRALAGRMNRSPEAVRKLHQQLMRSVQAP